MKNSVRGSFQQVSHQMCPVSLNAWLPDGLIQHFYEPDLCLNNPRGHSSIVLQPNFLSGDLASDVRGGSLLVSTFITCSHLELRNAVR